MGKWVGPVSCWSRGTCRRLGIAASAHAPLLQQLTGLIYFPINHAFPHFGLAAGMMYLPAKFKIRFLEPIALDGYGPQDADDLALVQRLADEVRARIQAEVDRLVTERRSVWFG